MQARRFANMAGVLRDLAEVGPHGASELGELDAGLAMEHWPAELAFQRADCIGQGRLGDAATPRCAREVELFAQSQEVADLMPFHDANLPWFDGDPRSALGVLQTEPLQTTILGVLIRTGDLVHTPRRGCQKSFSLLCLSFERGITFAAASCVVRRHELWPATETATPTFFACRGRDGRASGMVKAVKRGGKFLQDPAISAAENSHSACADGTSARRPRIRQSPISNVEGTDIECLRNRYTRKFANEMMVCETATNSNV